jgi:ABC-type transport system involved in multi-copper enzyme maturation permease subunit
MFRHIAAFELRYQLKSAVFWVGCTIFFLLTFGSVTSDQIQIGSRGSVHVNAPLAILQTLAIVTLFAVFVIVALVANVVIRDDATGFAPIVRTTSVSKRDYLLGRYVGALLVSFLVFASTPLGIFVGSLMPWLDPEKVGAFQLSHYLYALFVFALPTLLVVSAVFFSLATATRSMMATYVGAVAMVVLYLVLSGLFSDHEYDRYIAILDPFALSTLRVVTKYWTSAESNQNLPALSGLMLGNRILWTTIGVGLFALAYRSFRFESTGSGNASAKKPIASDPEVTAKRLVSAALPAPKHDRATRLRQAWSLARFDMTFVFKSPAFFVLLGIGVLNAMGSLWNAGTIYGGDVFPVTRLMIDALNGAFSLIPLMVAIYYAGELVWRDRERKIHEIVDATAAPDWVHLVPKILAIALVLIATTLASVVAAVIVQLLKGYTEFELFHYLSWYVVPASASALLLAVLSVFVQVLVPHKLLGWAVMLVYIVATVALSSAGFEHNLYNYGSWPEVPLSDMNGMGRFHIARDTFFLYWSSFALILCVLAYAVWPRGASDGLRARLRNAPRRLRGMAFALLGTGFVLFAASGAWIFYNTNVVNRYRTQPELDEQLADFEKALIRFETVAQPKIRSAKFEIEIYPRDTRVVTRGDYRIVNATSAPLPQVHVRWPDALRMDELEVEGAELEQEFGRHHYQIHRFRVPLAPGEERHIRFVTTFEERGFTNNRPLTRIVENGTFVNNGEIAPELGFSRENLLQDRQKRHKHGLPRELRPAPLEADAARAFSGLRHDSDWIDTDITVTTDADQTPIAPGMLVHESVHAGRRTARFKSDAPMMHFFSIQSARYAVQKKKWNDVELAVYYHPSHPYNVPRMLDAMALSLEIFSASFSPYQFKQARVLEFPGYARFAQSFANTMPYSESIGFIFDHQSEPDQIDMVTYVTAHEVAHQWWGHQLLPADQQGASMLVESFAQYSALLVMEKMYGRNQVRRFLKYELDRYLRSRGGEAIEELPLSRVENQPYIHYQKGTLAMYWLREIVGQAKVDRALSRLLGEFAMKPPPYANSRDFLRLLREEVGPEHESLIRDSFEKITLYDLSVKSATSQKRADGKFDVTLRVSARKLYADGRGTEVAAPLDEPFEVGVFTAEPGRADFGDANVLSLERRRLHDGEQTFTVRVDREPTYAGVDPYNKRIDRNSEDNLSTVDALATAAQ